MNTQFIIRNSCPVCDCTDKKIVKSILFTDNIVWNFLNTYYSSRIPIEVLVNVNYVIVACKECGLLYQENILNDHNMFQLYEKWILSEDSYKKKQGNINIYKGYAREIVNICKIFKKLPHEIKILEYGMGWGCWLRMANAYNYNVTGVEISLSRIEHVKKFGINILQNITDSETKYDYIYSNQVFEHIPNPLRTLQDLKKVLNTNGIIHIKIPNGTKMQAELKKKNWSAKKNALQPLEHINCFNKSSLEKMANLTEMNLHYSILKPSLFKIRDNMYYFFKLLSNVIFPDEVFLVKK